MATRAPPCCCAAGRRCKSLNAEGVGPNQFGALDSFLHPFVTRGHGCDMALPQKGMICGKLTAACRVYVAWSRRHSFALVEITRENLATYATYFAGGDVARQLITFNNCSYRQCPVCGS